MDVNKKNGACAAPFFVYSNCLSLLQTCHPERRAQLVVEGFSIRTCHPRLRVILEFFFSVILEPKAIGSTDFYFTPIRLKSRTAPCDDRSALSQIRTYDFASLSPTMTRSYESPTAHGDNRLSLLLHADKAQITDGALVSARGHCCIGLKGSRNLSVSLFGLPVTTARLYRK